MIRGVGDGESTHRAVVDVTIVIAIVDNIVIIVISITATHREKSYGSIQKAPSPSGAREELDELTTTPTTTTTTVVEFQLHFTALKGHISVLTESFEGLRPINGPHQFERNHSSGPARSGHRRPENHKEIPNPQRILRMNN